MKKVLFHCFLTLLVLSGYSQARASVVQNSGHNFVSKFLPSGYSRFSQATGKQSYAFSPATLGAKDAGKFFSEEKEEESNSQMPLKVLISCGHYFSVFYTRVPECCLKNLKRNLLASAHWFYSSSSRFIFLQVMRI